MEVEYVTIPKYIAVRTYPSIVGKVAVLEPDLPVGERLKIGCQLRRLGYKLIHEINNEKVSKFLDALCGMVPLDDVEWMDLDDLELDTYLKCERPHPVMGCSFIYFSEATAYQCGSSIAFEAKLPNGRFVWYNDIRNVFASEPPYGRPLNNTAFIWMALAMNDSLAAYDRYYVMLDVLDRRLGVRLYVDPHGNVISSEVHAF